MGHELLIIAPEGGAPTFEGIPVIGVPTVSVRFIYDGKPWGLPLPRVLKFLDDFQPDLVHVVNPFVLGVAGVWGAVKRRYPLVASYHTNIARYAEFYHLGASKPLIWAILRGLHNRAQVNLATSMAVQQELCEHGIQRVDLWRRGVDLEQFDPVRRSSQMRQRMTDGHPERLIAVYVGRLALEKGLDRLNGIFSGHPDLHLCLVGDGPARGQLEDRFKGKSVTFLGTLHGSALAEAYASADFFIFPSTTETLGLVLLEAMASGLPIVAAEASPTHELVDQSGAGALFAADDRHGLSKAVSQVLEQDLTDLSRKARKEAERWGWSVPTAELVQMYQRLHQERQRAL
jgi:glycosyltransferase involved in cell wall biosynthesis